MSASKNLGTLAFFGFAAAAGIAGFALRNQTDVRFAPTNPFANRTLVASTSDQQIPEADYFEQLSELLKEEYVDPVTDDSKLAAGAVKSMVASLNDVNSMYMDPTEFKAFQNAREGKYEGVGVDLVLESSNAKLNPESGQPVVGSDAAGFEIPKLTVASVVPGGPADKAGVKVGDWVESVDGKWVMNDEPIKQLRNAQMQADKGKLDPKQLTTMRKDLRDKIKRMIMPMRARDKILLGSGTPVAVSWMRAGKKLNTSMTKSESTVDLLASKGTSVALRFSPGIESQLQGQLRDGPLTLDLRNNAFGDFKAMKAVMELVAPKGSYGEIYKEKGGATALKVEQGTTVKRPITLIVDGSTRGVASVFARALAFKGVATLQGKPSADTSVVDLITLPDGSAFTLTTGKYRTSSKGKVTA